MIGAAEQDPWKWRGYVRKGLFCVNEGGGKVTPSGAAGGSAE